MKQLFYIAFAFVLASCAKEQRESAAPVNELGVTTFVTNLEQSTRIAVGEKVGATYKAVWEEGDVLSVLKADDSSNLGTATLSSGAGTPSATFTMPGTIADGTSVILAYGAVGVATEQTQASAGASSFKNYTNARSSAVTVMGGAAPAATLTHNTAILKASISSSSITGNVSAVIFRAEGGVLSGAASDYVKVNLTTPFALSATAQDVWAVAEPSNLTGREIDVALVITTATETYTLPVGFAGKDIKANKVSSFNLENISDNDCVSWYEPHDTRLMSGSGYAYGPANTYLIQCKNGSTYYGGTYTPSNNYSNSVAISIKARGNFLKVKNPVGASFEWARLGKIAEGQYNGTGDIYTHRWSNEFGAYYNIDPTQYLFSYDDATTVTVTNNGAYTGSPVLYMVKDSKILWAWTFWNIAADGTELATFNFCGNTSLANMCIGQSSNQYAKLKAMSYADGSATNKNWANYVSAFYYQWGRSIPVFWQSFWSFRWYGYNNTGNVPAIAGPLSIDEATSNPLGMIMGYDGSSTSDITRWCSDNLADLWGGTTHTKSNYDPCPKGWRVADQSVYTSAISAVVTNGTYTVTLDQSAGNSGIYLSSDPTVLVPNQGIVGGNGSISGMGLNQASNNNGRIWTNYIGSAAGENAAAFGFASNAAPTSSNFKIYGHHRTCAVPVRCMRDTDNR